jgi:hypothetical protein
LSDGVFLPAEGSDEERLNALFRAYRDGCPAPEPSPYFMPRLWENIEARQKSSFVFGRIAGAFVTAAMALSMGIAIYMYIPRSRNSAFYAESYVEALAASNAADTSEYYEAVRLESAEGDIR